VLFSDELDQSFLARSELFLDHQFLFDGHLEQRLKIIDRTMPPVNRLFACEFHGLYFLFYSKLLLIDGSTFRPIAKRLRRENP
jgi:hypothetical protein